MNKLWACGILTVVALILTFSFVKALIIGGVAFFVINQK